MSEALSEAENLLVGFIAAPVYTIALQPTMYFKHARMQHLPVTLDPRVLWRGTGATMCNETGQAGLQFVNTGLFKKWALGGAQRPLTPAEDALSAAASGVVSAAYVSPVELVVIQQQRFGGGLLETCQRVRRSFGWWGFTRGFVSTALRDSIVVVGMLSATPLVEAELEACGAHPTAGSFIGSLISGTAAGVISCPLDCIKACMKGDLERHTYNSFRHTAGVLWREGGAGRFFHGVGWRIANLSGTFFFISLARSGLEPALAAARGVELSGRSAQYAPAMLGAGA